MTTEIVPAEEATAVEGEVITPQDTLKANEQIIRRNWQKATEKVESVYRALTIIHTNDLWKLHKDEKGKRKYTAFDQYLFGEFGWELSRVRALQIIKAQRTKMIEAGELPASAAVPRTRTAPEVTAERAAKVTADQMQKVLDAFGTRVDNIDEGDPDRAAVVAIWTEAYETVGSVIDALRALVSEIESSEDETETETEGETAEATA